MRMPFGRHRGLLLSEIPASYLRWLTTLDDLDERLRAAVLDELESRGAGGYYSRRRGGAYREALAGPRPENKVIEEVIGAARRALALKHHPDKRGSPKSEVGQQRSSEATGARTGRV
jgi:hypothetical protein